MKRSELTDAERVCLEVYSAFTVSLNEIKAIGKKIHESLEPEIKKIDMSKFVGSKVLMDFSDYNEANYVLGFLEKIDHHGFHRDSCRELDYYEECRPKLNYINTWFGGECPLPEGLKVKISFSNCYNNLIDRYTELDWSAEGKSRIIAFEILGLADDWEW